MNILYQVNEHGFFSNFLKIMNWLVLKNYKSDLYFSTYFPNLDVNLLEKLFNFKNDNMSGIVFKTSEWVGVFDSNLCDIYFSNNLPSYDEYVVKSVSGHFVYDDINKDYNYGGHYFNNIKLYSDINFKEIRELYNKIYKNNFDLNLNQLSQLLKSSVKSKRTLGVHIRFKYHYENYSDWSDDRFLYESCLNICNEFYKGNFEQLYLATDQLEFFEILENLLGKDIILNINYSRVKNNTDWLFKNLSPYQEYLNVITDVVNLSYCEKVLGGSSNVFLFLLFYNSELKFDILDNLKNRNSG